MEKKEVKNFQAKLDAEYAEIVINALERHPDMNFKELVQAMIKNGGLDYIDKLDDSKVNFIKGQWCIMLRHIIALEDEKNRAFETAKVSVAERIEELERSNRELNYNSKELLKTIDELEVKCSKIDELKAINESLEKDKLNLISQNNLLQKNVIDSMASRELELENERLKTEIEKLKGELKYQNGFTDALIKQNEK